jgi:hypothetical protein
MSVAVCDTPVGHYQYYGVVHLADGYVIGSVPEDIRQFDPGIFVDDDGRIYLYSGFGMKDSPEWDEKFKRGKYDGAYCMELEPDIKQNIQREVIAIDGKTMRGMATNSHFKAGTEAKSIHMVSAWATENQLVFAQVQTVEKHQNDRGSGIEPGCGGGSEN